MTLIKKSTGFIPLNKVARITECIMLNITWKWNIWNKIKCIHNIFKITLTNRGHSGVKTAFFPIPLFRKPYITHVNATANTETWAPSWTLGFKYTSILRAGSIFPFPRKSLPLRKDHKLYEGKGQRPFIKSTEGTLLIDNCFFQPWHVWKEAYIGLMFTGWKTFSLQKIFF